MISTLKELKTSWISLRKDHLKHILCVAGKYYQVCLFQIIWWLRRGKPGKCKLQMFSMSSQHWGILNSFFQTMTPIKPMFLSFWKAVFVVTPVSVDNHLGKMRKRFGRQTEHRRQSSSTVMQQAKNSWNPQVPKSKEKILMWWWICSTIHFGNWTLISGNCQMTTAPLGLRAPWNFSHQIPSPQTVGTQNSWPGTCWMVGIRVCVRKPSCGSKGLPPFWEYISSNVDHLFHFLKRCESTNFLGSNLSIGVEVLARHISWFWRMGSSKIPPANLELLEGSR